MFGVDKKLVDKVKIETCAKYNDESVGTDFDIHYLETIEKRRRLLNHIR